MQKFYMVCICEHEALGFESINKITCTSKEIMYFVVWYSRAIHTYIYISIYIYIYIYMLHIYIYICYISYICYIYYIYICHIYIYICLLH